MKRISSSVFLKSIFCGMLIIIFLGMACTHQKKTPLQLVANYYKGYELGDFNQIRSLIGDSISISSGDYVSTYSHASFHEFFRWDSVLQTKKEVLSIHTSDTGTIASISYSSKRYKFLNNNHLTCNYRFSFKNHKIITVEELDCPNADWEAWEKQVGTLVGWTKVHHPELNGFINDLTMQGAMNYTKAITFFENREEN